MSTKPEAGQWWVMDDDPSEIVFVVGFTPEMECVIKWGDGDLSVDDMTDFHHEPRCTGWDWVVPEPQPEDPDEWVIQDRVPPRKDVDQISWGGGDWHSDWHKAWQFGNMMHGDYPRFGGRLNVRCRRRDLPKVEQPEQWPKYYTPLETVSGSVAFVRRDSAEMYTPIMADGQEGVIREWRTSDNVLRKQLTEAEAMALIKKPEPQPQKTRVRLWKNAYGSVMSNPDCENIEGWREIRIDSEGFYVEGGQS